MKITKPKETQILLEDESFKHFRLDVVSKTGLNESEFNEFYEGLILAYRQPNMDASKQMFFGNIPSICALMGSMLEKLVMNEIIDEKELKNMVKVVLKNVKETKKNNHA